jgi:hypothetical protein
MYMTGVPECGSFKRFKPGLCRDHARILYFLTVKAHVTFLPGVSNRG